MGQSAREDTDDAVHSVSLLYLDELAGRRERVVAGNLQKNISDINVALELMTDEDRSDMTHLQAYQTRMRRLYGLDKFAFVDSGGIIYTASGTQDNIADYQFDYRNLSEPNVSILNISSPEKKVVIAVPVDIPFNGRTFTVCFMEIDMQTMLQGVSMRSSNTDATFCNIYTKDGYALSNAVLGGLAAEDNLLDALKVADYEEGYSYEKMVADFNEGRRGEVSFRYNGIQETLSYVPIEGTDWLLTYLIRETVIADQISTISNGTIAKSLLQSVLTIVALLAMFALIFSQMRRNSQLLVEKESMAAANRAKQEELEKRLALQEQLLEQEQSREQQQKMITALASDYWSVYYLDLDEDRGVCYQAHGDIDDGLREGEEFPYMESVTAYANRYITEQYRSEFMAFVQPEAIQKALSESRVISYRYTVYRHGRETYEMVRFAGVRHPEDRDNDRVHSVGACFTNVDAETRKALSQNQALSDALEAAERANRAKTAFLSSMSHEIRTPMNAIIGLDSIALNDPDVPLKTRGYLEKIGDSAEHLLGLINDILDVSRIESGRMVMKNREFSFLKLIEYINTMFSGQCAEKGLDYQCHINGHVDDRYIGDDMRLRQVLINILGNAVKFTPTGGTVSLTVEPGARYEGKSVIKFVVADTGIGMSEEFLPHIFDTFSQEDSSTTSKYGSSGLGMAITKSLVDLMNGHIEVASKRGEGSTFTVAITLDDAENGSRENGEIGIDPASMSVLIVDDDPVACEHARLVLEKAGIASDIAASGVEAIDLASVRHARHNPYNLILVDWRMPEMDGIEATRRLRSVVGDESAIIILTAYRWDDVLEEALQAGVDGFISKPLFASAVIDEFQDALRRKGAIMNQGSSKAELAGRRVLLAEDVPVNAEIVIMALQMRGIETDLAENGLIALRKFSEHPEGYYDAILMDMRMPEMDGLEATKAIRMLDRSDAKKVPIIALTANAFDEDVQRSLQAGLNAHLSKPVHLDSLFETLETLIEA